MSGSARAEAPSLEAFAAAIRARIPEIAEAMLAAWRRRISWMNPGGDEAFRAAIAADVEAHLEGLHDPEVKGVVARARDSLLSVGQQGLPVETMFAIWADGREILLEAGLAVHASGVPGAAEGIRRLMAAQSAVGMLLDEVYRERAEQAETTVSIFETTAHFAPDAIGVANMDGVVVYANPSFQAMLGHPIVGHGLLELLIPEERERCMAVVSRSVLETGTWSGTLRYAHADGHAIEAHVTAFLVRDEQGRGTARCAIVRDLAPQREAEEERRRLQEEVIAAQRATLQELSTPLVPIAEGVVVMPLVGGIDAARADRMLGALLEGIVAQSARVAILDVTAVKGVDAQVAEALLGAARAARLLGAEVVLTGIQPVVAQAIVELGADLGSVATMSTLGEGVRHALGRARRRRERA